MIRARTHTQLSARAHTRTHTHTHTHIYLKAFGHMPPNNIDTRNPYIKL